MIKLNKKIPIYQGVLKYIQNLTTLAFLFTFNSFSVWCCENSTSGHPPIMEIQKIVKSFYEYYSDSESDLIAQSASRSSSKDISNVMNNITVELSVEEIRQTFDQYKVVQLRPIDTTADLCIVGCGNKPIVDNGDFHLHINALTINCDIQYNPTFLAYYGSKELLDFVQAKGKRFKAVWFEGTSPVPLHLLEEAYSGLSETDKSSLHDTLLIFEEKKPYLDSLKRLYFEEEKNIRIFMDGNQNLNESEQKTILFNQLPWLEEFDKLLYLKEFYTRAKELQNIKYFLNENGYFVITPLSLIQSGTSEIMRQLGIEEIFPQSLHYLEETVGEIWADLRFIHQDFSIVNLLTIIKIFKFRS